MKISDSWSNFTQIYIVNNNWTTAQSFGWVSGNGLAGDPYILENMTIDAQGSGSGIIIENSSLYYFRIRNCTVYNSGSGNADAGIKLTNTNNGTLLDNNCSSNENGIYLERCNNKNVQKKQTIEMMSLTWEKDLPCKRVGVPPHFDK